MMTDFKLTAKQERANQLLGSDAAHIMLYGGSRSGKTFLLTRAVLVRAIKAPRSRHTILRYRFNAVKQSVILDTLPKMMDLCFPGLMSKCHLDKSDWFLKLWNGSEIWFGGLDDKERTEKILGQEYATIYLNECSQIPWLSREMAMTRLAQKVDGLKLKAYYDCNPPSVAHWTYRVFVEKRDPEKRSGLRNPDAYASMVMNPADNAENLDRAYLDSLDAMSEKMRRRFLLGQFSDMSDSALWSFELLDQGRIVDGQVPDMARILVAVDPSGVSGEEDTRSDEVGIVVVGLGVDGRAYILEDLSGRQSPAAWGKAVVSAFDRHKADAVVVERNFGGAMVKEVIRGAANSPERRDNSAVPVREVVASRGKVVRAEPVAALFEQGKVSMVGTFPELEDQLVAFTMAGYMGNKSPDRADAMIWGLNSIFPAVTRAEASPFGHTPKVHVAYPRAMRSRRFV